MSSTVVFEEVEAFKIKYSRFAYVTSKAFIDREKLSIEFRGKQLK